MRFLKFSLAFLIVGVFHFLSNEAKAQVSINEFVPDASPEWVEFYNASDSAEFLKSYWLDDDVNFDSDSGSSSKKSLSDLNTVNSSYPFVQITSFLNNTGDYVVLFDPNGALVDQYQYTSNPGDNVSIGRNPDGSGSFVILASSTKGAPNSGPQPTPTPTPSPVPSPTPSPTPKSTAMPKPTPTPASTPTHVPKTEATSTPKPEVKAQKAEETSLLSSPSGLLKPTPIPKTLVGEESDSWRKLVVPFVLVIAGGALVVLSAFPFVKQFLSRYNEIRSETSDET